MSNLEFKRQMKILAIEIAIKESNKRVGYDLIAEAEKIYQYLIKDLE